jgi:hypothetical protein
METINKPKHQHFIPRSYLNNFSYEKDNTPFVQVKIKNNEDIKEISTSNICVKKNIYSLPTSNEKIKYSLEHFYADNIDSKFPNISNILKDRNIEVLDNQTKIEIISVALSLYFRTPKFLNYHNSTIEKIVRHYTDKEIKPTKINYLGREIFIQKDEVETLIEEEKQKNKLYFLKEHLFLYQELVKSKINDTINVYHIVDESEFITSDNPVLIRGFVDPTDPNYSFEEYSQKTVNPFDQTNTIHLPIDNKTMLSILPNDKNESIGNIFRLDKLKIDTVIFNHDIELYSENCIIGNKTSLSNYFKDKTHYVEGNEDAEKQIKDYMEKTNEMKALLNIIQDKGFNSKELKSEIERLSCIDSVKQDLGFQKIKEYVEQK